MNTTPNHTVKTVVDNELCSGCGTCNATCPTHAIRMDFTTLGRLVPIVDETICVGCGLCLKACPGIGMDTTMDHAIDTKLIGHVESTYFARCTEKSMFDNAQSGGAVTATLAFLFDQGRIDAALVVGQKHQKAQYRIVTSKRELLDCQSSQYTPVDLNSALPSLAKFAHVAVIGLPCHIEGITKLKSLFPERYRNIEYLLGLICGGVLAQSCVEVVKHIGQKKVGTISDDSRIYWRLRKFSNYKQAKIAFVDGQDIRTIDNNVRLSCKRHLTPPRCKLCFDKMNLFCDIAFGDSWGITGNDTKDGGSVIITRTAKGQALVDEMNSHGTIVSRPCPLEEIAKGQHLAEKRQASANAIAVYRQKTLQVPNWAELDIFSNGDSNSPLTSEITTFLEREKCPHDEVVASISKKVSKRAAWKHFTGIIRKILKIG